MNNSLLGSWLPNNLTGDLEITVPGQKVVPADFLNLWSEAG